MAIGRETKPCNVVLHDDSISKEDVLCGSNVLPPGGVAYLVAPNSKALCILARTPAKNADEISVHASVAREFGFENRMRATIQLVEYIEAATAAHVELFFRDQHLSRADMWRITAQVDGTVLYQGQKLAYLGSSIARVETIYIAGQQVDSAYLLHPQTRLIFRSGSARFVMLIQISKEMLEYWISGDLMYERLISGFLPELFRRWDEFKVRHQVTVVLFGRRSAPAMPQNDKNKPASSQLAEQDDFFHVLAADLPSADWRSLLRMLKKAFNGITLSRQVCLAAKGNMLEAINIAAMDFSKENLDPHLATTGTSIIAVTAGAGLFDADHELLRRTTKLLMGNSIGVDIVSLSPKPHHPVPLFQYIRNKRSEFALPHWADISYWGSNNDDLSSKWLLPDSTEDVDDIVIPAINPGDVGDAEFSTASTLDAFDEQMFRSTGVPPDAETLKPLLLTTSNNSQPENGLRPASAGSTQTAARMRTDSAGQKAAPSPLSGISTSSKTKKAAPPPHPLMQMGRKISVGPKGLALSQGVASTTVSAQHAQYGKDATAVTDTTNSDGSSGLAKQIRQSLRGKPSQRSLTSPPQPDQSQTSKPIDIKQVEEDKPEDPHDDPASIVEKAMMEHSGSSGVKAPGSLSPTPKAATATQPLPSAIDAVYAHSTVSPWLTLLNPCNPRRDNMQVASEYRQWQNVFPKAVSSGSFKWESMCTPAVLPLITEHRISLTELENHFEKKIRRLLATETDAHWAMVQMISLRFTAGFQIVPTRRSENAQMPSEKIERMLLSLGDHYHELRCLSNVEVEVSEYDHGSIPEDLSNPKSGYDLAYPVKLKTAIARKECTTKINLAADESISDWSSLDDQCVNIDAFTNGRGSSLMRFVLIPVEFPHNQTHAQARELSDEERRIDGIQRLTQMWQRNRYFVDEDQRRHSSMTKPKTSHTIDRDPNPLAIEYQTRDPSVVVKGYGTTLAGQLANGEVAEPLFAEAEKYHSSNFDMVKLVKHLQEPPPVGVELKDRRWFTRFHLKCFRGDEVTNWLLHVFKDLETREDAVALGNQLMEKDIITHVRGKHEFRDGNYFYQIKSEHRTTAYPDTTGFFARGIGRSVPSTPMMDSKSSPSVRAVDSDSSKGAPTPNLAPTDREKKELLLSQMLQYNVDPGKKSSQLEIINLHYYRIHNPDNCYHIQLDWTNTTPKMIRDSVSRWSSLVEGHGLKLVQVPLREASKIHQIHPFEEPTRVRLIKPPPDKVLATPHLDPHAGSPRAAEDPTGFHKAVLRKADFVLDLEAASRFPRNLDIAYSWGRPNYQYTQFIHRSGLLLAQICNDGRADFLLLRNPLTSQSSSKKTDTNSLESTVKNFKAFCRNEPALTALYDEVNKPKVSPLSPLSNAILAADSDVPPMELPPHENHKPHKAGGTVK